MTKNSINDTLLPAQHLVHTHHSSLILRSMRVSKIFHTSVDPAPDKRTDLHIQCTCFMYSTRGNCLSMCRYVADTAVHDTRIDYKDFKTVLFT